MTVNQINKHQIQFVTSLHHAKFREKFNKFIVEGEKICKECLKRSPALVTSIFALRSWIDEHHSIAQDIDLFEVNEQILNKISAFKTPNQVLMVCEQLPQGPISQDGGIHFYLDHIQDPGNLGTIIRLIDWFGLGTLYLSPGCVDLFNPKVVQATMGSIFNLTYRIISLSALLTEQPSLTVYGADLVGSTLAETTFKTPGLVIIGSESHGILQENRPYVHHYVQIPKNKKAVAESLNAATATAILAYQINLAFSQ